MRNKKNKSIVFPVIVLVFSIIFTLVFIGAVVVGIVKDKAWDENPVAMVYAAENEDPDDEAVDSEDAEAPEDAEEPEDGEDAEAPEDGENAEVPKDDEVADVEDEDELVARVDRIEEMLDDIIGTLDQIIEDLGIGNALSYMQLFTILAALGVAGISWSSTTIGVRKSRRKKGGKSNSKPAPAKPSKPKVEKPKKKKKKKKGRGAEPEAPPALAPAPAPSPYDDPRSPVRRGRR